MTDPWTRVPSRAVPWRAIEWACGDVGAVLTARQAVASSRAPRGPSANLARNRADSTSMPWATGGQDFPARPYREHSYDDPMKLGPDPDTAAWLAGSPEFEWDDGNSTKSERKHAITIAEMESIFAGRMVFAGRIVEPDRGEPRWLLLGETDTGRPVALVFTRRGERVRPVTCRPMRTNERVFYGNPTQH